MSSKPFIRRLTIAAGVGALIAMGAFTAGGGNNCEQATTTTTTAKGVNPTGGCADRLRDGGLSAYARRSVRTNAPPRDGSLIPD
jgi:hypothetical protein